MGFPTYIIVLAINIYLQLSSKTCIGASSSSSSSSPTTTTTTTFSETNESPTTPGILSTTNSVVSDLCGGDGTKFDIVLLFDDSGSQDATEFGHQVSFFKEITNMLYIASDYVNVAAVKVDSTAEEIFGLRDHLTNASVSTALGTVTKRGGSSVYENGLEMAYNDIIVPNKRNDSRGVVISVTDDGSADTSSTTRGYVASAQAAGDIFIVVGISAFVPGAATDPSYFWRLGTTSDLSMLVPYIVNVICPHDCGIPPNRGADVMATYTSTLYGSVVTYECGFGFNIDPPPYTTVCNITGWGEANNYTCVEIECGRGSTALDVVFLLDESSSMDNTEFLNQIYFFQNISQSLYIGNEYARVAAIGASTNIVEHFNLTAYTSYTQVHTALSTIVSQKGTSVYEGGIQYAYETLIANYRRPNATAVVVSVTDYSYADSNTVIALAATASAAGDKFIVLSHGVDNQAAATSPDHYFRTTTSTEFRDYVDDVMTIICPPNCSTPVSLSNAKLNYSSTVYGDRADYTCDIGYTPSITLTSVSCLINGSWETPTFTCDVYDCTVPRSVSHATVNYTLTTYGAYAEYTCDPNYVLNGTTSVIMCTETGWSSPNFTCEPFDCGTPLTITHATPSYTLTTYGSVVTYSCNTGYQESTSNTSIVCGASWSSPGFNCTIIDCGKPPVMSFGSANYTQTEYNSTATYECNYGYNASNSMTTITCLDTGSWEQVGFTCDPKDCSTPPVINHGQSSYTQTTLGHNVTYTCDTGYNLSYIPSKIECLAYGWSMINFTCDPIDCDNPPVISHSTTGVVNSTTYLSTVTYNCDLGYNPSSSINPITCTENGWTTPGFTCDPNDCNVPGSVSHATVNYTLTTYGAYAEYACDPNYVLNGTTSVVMCTETGWSSPNFTCQLFDCGAPLTITHATPVYTLTTYGSVVTYSCNTGYLASTSNTSIVCGASWSSPGFNCTIIDCGKPPVVSFGSANYTQTDYNSTATYECNYGYNASNSMTIITCLDTGSWEQVGFTCDPKDCSTPPVINHGQSSYTQTTLGHNVTYTCDTGYTLSYTPAEIVCLAYGWSMINFTCDPIDCGNPPVISNSTTGVVNSTTYLSTVTYNCDLGYNPSSSINPITCTENGWTTPGLTCDPNDCGTPSPVIKGQPSYTYTTYLHIATYTCDTGYVLTGSYTGEITCGPSTWSSINFTCEPFDCGLPVLVNHSTNNVALTTYGNTVTFTCDPGYNATVSMFVITCNVTGWEGGNFTCTEIDCGPPPLIPKGTPSYSSTKYGSNATYKCDLGWTTSLPVGVVNCGMTEWDKPTFECIRNDCGESAISYKSPSLLTTFNDTDEGQMYILLDDAYEITCVGLITHWEFVPMTTGFVYFMVWRKYDSSSYTFVGQNSALISDTSAVFNYTVPEREKIAVMPGDRVGWYAPSFPVIPYDTCSTMTNSACPQHTRKRPGSANFRNGHVVNWLSVPAMPDRAYSLKIYTNNNTALNFSKPIFNATIADHSLIGRAVTTLYLDGKDFAEKVTYYMTPDNTSLDYFVLDTKFGTVKVKHSLPRARDVPEYVYNVTAMDSAGNWASTELVISTFNAPPYFSNLPSTITIFEDKEPNELLYTIDVIDFTNDDICCTIESIRPQTTNFELLLNGTSLQLYTTRNARFVFADFNSYRISVCCEDVEQGRANGILQVDIKEVKEKQVYTPPQWFYGSIIISCVPLATMMVLGWSFLLYDVLVM